MSEEHSNNEIIDGNDEEANSNSERKQKFPKAVLFIIGNEFCERFTFYGMINILTLYFTTVLGFDDDKATEYYHSFTVLCYFTPIIGAYIADSFLGKYRTIFYISFVYAAGNLALSYSSYLENKWVTLTGLLLIAMGTGGIKPCVSAFGADQFDSNASKSMEKFFSFFYLSINAGGLLSTLITPILRKDVHCNGREDCFPLAFGVPSILMLLAIALFITGRYTTGYKINPPKKGNVVVTFICCVFYCLWRKIKSIGSGYTREHWLDHGLDKYDSKTVSEIKMLTPVLFLFLPLPIFWALFDQQGSRWTLQATKMNGDFFGIYRFHPDQIQFLNPLLIITLVPLFEYVLYPILNRVGLLTKPLQKMTTGGVLAALAFIICAFLQLSIETDLPNEPKGNHAHIAIVNGLPCGIRIDSFMNSKNPIDIDTLKTVDIDLDLTSFSHDFSLTCNTSSALTYTGYIDQINSEDMPLLYIYGIEDSNGDRKVRTELINTRKDPKNSDNQYLLSKPEEGGVNARIFFTFNQFNHSDTNFSISFNDEKSVNEFSWITESIGYSDYYELDVFKIHDYSVYIHFSDSNARQELAKNIIQGVDQGGSYIIVISGDYSQTENKLSNYSIVRNEIVKPNSILMILQVFQYIVMTSGELLFSIVGLTFSYSQAPKSMKSVLQASWLLTVSLGDSIIILVAGAKFFDKQSNEFFFFSGLMLAFMVLFAIMAYFYKPQKAVDDETSDADNGSDNTERSDDSIAAIKRENNKFQ